MSDRYTVINKEEGRGQSVAENGIPCTAIHCATQLNRLSRDNEKLEKEVIVLKDKLKSIKFVVMCYNSELTKELFKENSFPEEMIICGKLKLLNELKEEILEIINED